MKILVSRFPAIHPDVAARQRLAFGLWQLRAPITPFREGRKVVESGVDQGASVNAKDAG